MSIFRSAAAAAAEVLPNVIHLLLLVASFILASAKRYTQQFR
jgi:hypothetical protein